MSKKKILFITYRADVGGGPKHLFELLSGIKQHNLNIQSYICCPTKEYYSKEFQRLATLFPLRKGFQLITTLVKLKSFIKKEEIAVVHSHGRGAGLISRVLKILNRNIRVVHTFHGVHSSPNFSGIIKLYLDLFLERFTDTFISCSKSERELAIKNKLCRPDKCTVVYNSLNLDDLFNTKNFTDQISISNYLDHNKFILGTLARFNYQKGLDILLNNFKLLNTKHPDKFKLIIAGNGELELEIKNLATKLNLSETVIFLGEIHNVYNFLTSLDCYISTARWEGLPLAVLEAMSCNKPCVLSEVTGHTDFRDCAYLYNLENTEDFCEKIVELSNDIKIQQDLIQKATKKLANEHSFNKWFQSTTNILLD